MKNFQIEAELEMPSGWPMQGTRQTLHIEAESLEAAEAAAFDAIDNHGRQRSEWSITINECVWIDGKPELCLNSHGLPVSADKYMQIRESL